MSDPTGTAAPTDPRHIADDLRVRIRHAQGVTDPDVDRAITEQTENALGQGLVVKVFEDGTSDDAERLDTARKVRDFFEKKVGGRITLMDIADMTNVASPLERAEEVLIRHKPWQILTICASNGEPCNSSRELKFDLKFNGSRNLKILRRGIFLGEELKGLGVGARWLLMGALFAGRHGIGGWRSWIGRDGLLVWPKFGAEIELEGVERALRSLEKLKAAGVLKSFSSNDFALDDLEGIASITVGDAAGERAMALNAWIDGIPMLEERDRDYQAPPHPVGRLALTGAMVFARFETERTLNGLLDDYLPRRIERERSAHTRGEQGKRLLAYRGLKRDYFRGLIERRLFLSMGKFGTNAGIRNSMSGVRG